MEGRKYRSEPVLSLGSRFPINLIYHYNSQVAAEPRLESRAILRSKSGSTGNWEVPKANMRLVSTTAPLTGSSYITASANVHYEGDMAGVKKTLYSRANQYWANRDRFWRHNYEEAYVLKSNGESLWVQSSGHVVTFTNGKSAVYPDLILSELDATEFGFAGHRLLDASSGLTRIFDDTGRLRRLINKEGIYHALSYDTNNSLTEIAHSLGGSLNFEYQVNDRVKTAYAVGYQTDYLPVRVFDSAGRSVVLAWDSQFQTKISQKFLLTFISNVSTGQTQTGRAFAYADTRWPNALTDIYTVTNRSTNEQALYAHFDYDELGRAVSSALAGDVDKITVQYPSANERVVTNALGKNTRYHYAVENGVNRLQSIEGEASVSCAPSNIAYQHDVNGNIVETNENGLITQYSYNNRGLETERIEAVGTLEARTILTTWHATLPLPVRIEQGGQTTVFSYDAEGRLLSRTVTPIAP